MSDFLFDQYEEYLLSFRAWGHEFFKKPLTFDQFESFSVDLEMIEIDEEFDHITDEQRQKREQLELLMLTHESYFEDGPRVTIIVDESQGNR